MVPKKLGCQNKVAAIDTVQGTDSKNMVANVIAQYI
jgi:hypothetical protein